ncbi:Retrovirus-related Pol polyprotein from transposon opus [Exaiptasia diaphana]|nr:Retrovirus-related Pol polyprotein from transposon opus [Exaiptasia diaphana]
MVGHNARTRGLNIIKRSGHASKDGLGALLYQRQDGKMRVIGYGSRALTAAEKNYHLHSGKLEFLALKWAVCEHFRDHLYYSPHFTIYTDNNPLTYVLTTAKLNATGLRWVAELSDFNFTIKYRPGKVNIDADCLSRLPGDFDKYMSSCTETFSQTDLSATVTSVQTSQYGECIWIAAITDDVTNLELGTCNMASKTVAPIDIKQAQNTDPIVRRVIDYVNNNTKPSLRERLRQPRELRKYINELSKLRINASDETTQPRQLHLFKASPSTSSTKPFNEQAGGAEEHICKETPFRKKTVFIQNPNQPSSCAKVVPYNARGSINTHGYITAKVKIHFIAT